MKKIREIRICPICKKGFGVRPSDPQIYCSKLCSNSRTKIRKIKVCPICKNNFEGYEYNKYCSQKCCKSDPEYYKKISKEHLDSGQGKYFTCKNPKCKKEFHRPKWCVDSTKNIKYCSKECKDSGTEVRTCRICKEDFGVQANEAKTYEHRVTCSRKCFNIYRKTGEYVEFTKLVRNRMSPESKEARNEKISKTLVGHEPQYPQAYFVDKLGHNVRSSLEEKGLLMLREAGYNYRYEKPYLIIYETGERRHYLPDVILDGYICIEFKGYPWPDGMEKLKLFRDQYPLYRILVVVEDIKSQIYDEYRNQFDLIELDNLVNVLDTEVTDSKKC